MPPEIGGEERVADHQKVPTNARVKEGDAMSQDSLRDCYGRSIRLCLNASFSECERKREKEKERNKNGNAYSTKDVATRGHEEQNRLAKTITRAGGF